MKIRSASVLVAAVALAVALTGSACAPTGGPIPPPTAAPTVTGSPNGLYATDREGVAYEYVQHQADLEKVATFFVADLAPQDGKGVYHLHNVRSCDSDKIVTLRRLQKVTVSPDNVKDHDLNSQWDEMVTFLIDAFGRCLNVAITLQSQGNTTGINNVDDPVTQSLAAYIAKNGDSYKAYVELMRDCYQQFPHPSLK